MTDQEERDWPTLAPEKKLMILQQDWHRAKTLRAKAFIEGRIIEITDGLPEHPEGFELGCICDMCREYAQ